jgi:hypothetical protein
MRLNQPIHAPKFDLQRTFRLLMWASLAISLVAMLWNVVGLACHLIMVMLDTSFGSRWTPNAPYVTWALAGALIGVGPALWSIPYLRKRKMLVLWVPLALILAIGLASCLPGWTKV